MTPTKMSRNSPRNSVPAWRNWGDHPLVVAIIVIAAIGSTVALLRPGDPGEPPSVTSRRNTPTPADAGRGHNETPPFDDKARTALSSPVTFQELMSYIFREIHTQAQIDEFLERHLGRRVTWEGWVGNVAEERGKGFSVLISTEESETSELAFLIFPSDYKPDLLAVNFGQKIRAACMLQSFSGQAHLEDCELLKVWPMEKDAHSSRR